MEIENFGNVLYVLQGYSNLVHQDFYVNLIQLLHERLTVSTTIRMPGA